MMPAQAVSWLIEIVLPSAMSNESRTTTLQARGYGFESRWLHPCGSTQLPHNRVRRGCATTPKLAERLVKGWIRIWEPRLATHTTDVGVIGCPAQSH
jgi:hypothetical protein